MLSITELKKYEEDYEKRSNRALLERDSVHGFIDFIDKEQAKKGSSVITLEKRETARRLKEMGKRIEENKPFDPEEDFSKL